MSLWIYGLFLLWKTTSTLCQPAPKISPKLMTEENIPNVYVEFRSTRDSLQLAKKARPFGTPAEKAADVHFHLLRLAYEEQQGVVNFLISMKRYQFEIMWLTNRIYIRNADWELVKLLSNEPNVTYIREESSLWLDFRMDHHSPWPSFGHKNVTESLKKIQAPEAWEVFGGSCKAGEGVVVGIMDNLAFVEHEALVENFEGMEFGYLKVQQENGTGPGYSEDHGSFVTGIVVGRNGIGVAPAAKHSQCGACNLALECSERSVEKCMEFFICPPLKSGKGHDCSRRVDVINVSFWSNASNIRPIFDAATAAGILLVANMGSNYKHWLDTCAQGKYPALFDNVIAVGGVDLEDNHIYFSSKGPNANPMGHTKPDVVAPGYDIISANRVKYNRKYNQMYGLSFAAPHVTGLVALLLTRDKTLTQDQARKLIIENTDRLYPKESECTNGSQNTWPNPEFGYGRINALKTINAQTMMLAGRKTGKN